MMSYLIIVTMSIRDGIMSSVPHVTSHILDVFVMEPWNAQPRVFKLLDWVTIHTYLSGSHNTRYRKGHSTLPLP
eukprot:scaffold27511_cov19-Prasinocladus_malaysianus.AAC.1